MMLSNSLILSENLVVAHIDIFSVEYRYVQLWITFSKSLNTYDSKATGLQLLKESYGLAPSLCNGAMKPRFQQNGI